MNNRKEWPDFCKFIAMLFVTWGHAAQAISNENFSNLLGGNGYLAAFHMPLFFIMSGYFIKLDKIRETKTILFLQSKFRRLLLPALSWTAIYCLILSQTMEPTSFVSFYWYLSSLFLSFVVIVLFSKCIKSNALTIFLSTSFVILCPFTDFSNFNFMFPFLWVGYALRVNKHNNSNVLFIITAIITILLLLIWNYNFTVYLSRFNTAHLSVIMVIKYAIRFIMGGAFSYVIIWLSRRFEYTIVVSKFSRLGQYTLTTYTVSFIVFGLVRKYLPVYINTPFVLDILSLIVCILVYYLCVKIHILLSRNKYTSSILLGI